jgi:hypothetical protein
LELLLIKERMWEFEAIGKWREKWLLLTIPHPARFEIFGEFTPCFLQNIWYAQ